MICYTSADSNHFWHAIVSTATPQIAWSSIGYSPGVRSRPESLSSESARGGGDLTSGEFEEYRTDEWE